MEYRSADGVTAGDTLFRSVVCIVHKETAETQPTFIPSLRITRPDLDIDTAPRVGIGGSISLHSISNMAKGPQLQGMERFHPMVDQACTQECKATSPSYDSLR